MAHYTINKMEVLSTTQNNTDTLHSIGETVLFPDQSIVITYYMGSGTVVADDFTATEENP